MARYLATAVALITLGGLPASTGFSPVAARQLAYALAAPRDPYTTSTNNSATLTWTPVLEATRYNVFRSLTDTFSDTPIATVMTTSYVDTGLTFGTTYSYRVAAGDDFGFGPVSPIARARPGAPQPPAVTATGGDRQVAVSWSALSNVVNYKLFRSLEYGVYPATPIATVGPATTSFVDTGLDNGPGYYYAVVVDDGGLGSVHSRPALAFTEGPPTVVDAATTAAFRLLRRTTWGPKPGDIERVKQMGADAFIDEQLALPASTYSVSPLSDINQTQQRFLVLAMTAPDQLRQRVAWALHKIWVVSVNDVDAGTGIAAYQQILMQNAFGNYRDLMEAITLNPAMGRYLTMLDNQSEAVSGSPANENYAREIMQLFTIGTVRLNADGSPMLAAGAPIPSYTQADVSALARIFTGWTFGDGDPATVPSGLANANYAVPMEPVAAFHDTTAKTLLGQSFQGGVSARQELTAALDLLFNHPNVGPFVGKQLIQQLVTSNPSPAYVSDIAAVFNDNGNGVRGDLRAVVRAILRHPETGATGTGVGRLSEPILMVLTFLRGLNAPVPDYAFLILLINSLGQKVLAPPTVFSYFPPSYRVRGTGGSDGLPLLGPEFQLLTTNTALERINLLAQILNENFAKPYQIDYSPLTSRAGDAAVLVDYCKEQFLGGRMSPATRAAIITAVRYTPEPYHRVRTALYLVFGLAQAQID